MTGHVITIKEDTIILCKDCAPVTGNDWGGAPEAPSGFNCEICGVELGGEDDRI